MVILFIIIFGLMFLISVVTLLVYIVMLIFRKRTKLGLVSGLAFVLSIFALILANYSSNQHIKNYVIPENKVAVISYADYATARAQHVLAALGEPNKKTEAAYDEYDENSPIAATWTYYEKRLEFYFINNKLVQFTYYGNNQPYDDIKEVFDLFGIQSSTSLTLVSDNGKMIKYKKPEGSYVIDEFTLTHGSSDKTIGIVKVTYDAKYF